MGRERGERKARESEEWEGAEGRDGEEEGDREVEERSDRTSGRRIQTTKILTWVLDLVPQTTDDLPERLALLGLRVQ